MAKFGEGFWIFIFALVAYLAMWSIYVKYPDPALGNALAAFTTALMGWGAWWYNTRGQTSEKNAKVV